MSRVTGGIARRWRAVTGAASAATIGLGFLVLGCAGVAMAGPRASTELETNAVRQLIAQNPPDAKAFVAMEPFTEAVPPAGTLTAEQLTSGVPEFKRNLAGFPLSRGGDLMAFSSGFTPVNDTARSLGPGTGATLEAVYQTGFASHVRFVQGTLPAGFRLRPKSTPIFPIAVTVATARRYSLRIGSLLQFSAGALNSPPTFKVTGIIAMRHPTSPFWTLDPIQSTPSLVIPSHGSPYWQGGAFITASELVPIENLLDTNAAVRWVLPLRLGNITGSQAIALANKLSTALQQDGSVTIAGTTFTATLSCGVFTVLTTFAQQASAVNSLLSLLWVSLAAVCATVLLLAVWLLTEQRYVEFATLRGRGASRRQLAWLATRAVMLTVLPGVAIGVAAAVAATPGSGDPLGWWLTGLILLAVLAGLPLLTMRRHGSTAPANRREDAPVSKRAATRRLVIEACLVLAAAGGVIVLRDQGLTPGRSDPYTSLAPVLVAVPVAIVVLRCYPLLTRPLLRLTGRRPGVAGFVGLARAIRTAITAGLPVFAMVLALTLVAFSGMVRDAVVRGEVVASWQRVGADAAVNAPGGIGAASARTIAAVPGVQRTAALNLTSGSFPNYNPFGVVGVDPGQYSALVAGTPVAATLRGRSAGAVPVLATPGLAARLRSPGSTVELADRPVRVTVVGQVEPIADLSVLVGQQYLVVPRAVLGGTAGPPDMMLIVGSSLDAADLKAVVNHLGSRASIDFRSPVLAQLESAPLQHGAYLAFALGSAIAGLLSVLVLLLALIIGGRSRQMTIARMSTMGMSGRQGRRLVILELVPEVLAAVVGGAACAALLAPLLGPSLDLSVFTGTSASVPIRIDPEFVGGAAVALAVLALLTLTVQTAIAGRKTATSLRIGE
jgi:putative ABC transport system permease protein